MISVITHLTELQMEVKMKHPTNQVMQITQTMPKMRIMQTMQTMQTMQVILEIVEMQMTVPNSIIELV